MERILRSAQGDSVELGKMKKFRLRFTLSDSRKIYLTEKGQFRLVEELESARVRNMIEGGAYTQTLSMFFATSSGAQPDSVRIVNATLEPASARVDKTAFVLGGRLAVDLPLKP